MTAELVDPPTGGTVVLDHPRRHRAPGSPAHIGPITRPVRAGPTVRVGWRTPTHHSSTHPHTFRSTHTPAAIIEAFGATNAAAVLGGNLDTPLAASSDHA